MSMPPLRILLTANSLGCLCESMQGKIDDLLLEGRTVQHDCQMLFLLVIVINVLHIPLCLICFLVMFVLLWLFWIQY